MSIRKFSCLTAFIGSMFDHKGGCKNHSLLTEMRNISKSDKSSVWSHEESYQGFSAVAMTHRNRLKHIISLLNKIEFQDGGTLADYGCSDGYIISLLQREIFSDKNWKFYGFDHNENLLSKARAKYLPKSEFHFFDLNIVGRAKSNSYDIVTCFETLEHTGDYRNAFLNIYSSCKIGGCIAITIPNEKGISGLLKYFGRKLLRRKDYGDIFSDKSELNYVMSLILNRYIDVFRYPSAKGWGHHLGFDYRRFEEYIQEIFLEEQHLEIIFQRSSALNFNRLYVFRKLK